VILAFVYWIISRAFPYRESCWQEWDYYLNYLKGFYPPILSGKNLFELLNWEFERYRYIRIYEIAFITIALMFGSSRRKAQDRHILSITILTFILLFTFLIAHKSTFYTIYLYPFFMLSVTSFSYLSKNKFKIIVGKAMVLMLVLFYMFQSGEILYQFKGSNYYKYIDEIKKFIQPGSGIAGQPTWWYGFYDTNRYYALSVVDIGRKGVASHIKKRDIRYLLIDEYWREHFPLGMKDFLRRECMLIGRLKDKFYGAESFSPSETYYKLDIYRVKGH